MRKVRGVVLGLPRRDWMRLQRLLGLSTVGFGLKQVGSKTARTSLVVSARGTNWFVGTNTLTTMSQRLKMADMLA